MALLDEVGAGARAHREGLVHHGVELAFGGARHRIDMHAATGKTVMIYGQTEVTLDLMNARKAAGLATVYQAADVQPHDFDTDQPARHLRQGWGQPRDRMRLHRRLRRLPWRQPRQRQAVGDPDLRAGLSVRLARHPVGNAAGQSRTDLFQPRARICAVHDALDPPQPLLRAVPARRRYRAVAGRAVLGRTEAPARPEGGRRTRHRALDRKEHRAAAQLRRRADALRPDVFGRRRLPTSCRRPAPRG